MTLIPAPFNLQINEPEPVEPVNEDSPPEPETAEKKSDDNEEVSEIKLAKDPETTKLPDKTETASGSEEESDEEEEEEEEE